MDGLQLKYFVLKPKGSDRYAEASRKAMRAYAAHIDSVNQQFAKELRQWADNEHEAAQVISPYEDENMNKKLEE